jgi:hypothetical protein
VFGALSMERPSRSSCAGPTGELRTLCTGQVIVEKAEKSDIPDIDKKK